jgi:hypothetical protein
MQYNCCLSNKKVNSFGWREMIMGIINGWRQSHLYTNTSNAILLPGYANIWRPAWWSCQNRWVRRSKSSNVNRSLAWLTYWCQDTIPEAAKIRDKSIATIKIGEDTESMKSQVRRKVLSWQTIVVFPLVVLSICKRGELCHPKRMYMSRRLMDRSPLKVPGPWKFSEFTCHPLKVQFTWILEENVSLCGKRYMKLFRIPVLSAEDTTDSDIGGKWRWQDRHSSQFDLICVSVPCAR